MSMWKIKLVSCYLVCISIHINEQQNISICN
nr:MAG TPA: CLLAC-motif containing domain protein [Caudoviricetes sp.]